MKLGDILRKAYEENAPWDETIRLDVIIRHPARDGTNEIIRRAVQVVLLYQAAIKAQVI